MTFVAGTKGKTVGRMAMTGWVLVLALILSPGTAADEAPWLRPCSDSPAGDVDWPGRLLKTLFPDHAPGADMGCVVMPSFEPEWAIVLDCGSGAASGSLEYRVARMNVWHANWVPAPVEGVREVEGWSQTPVPVAVDIRHVPLSPATCAALRGLWEGVLSDLRRGGTPGLDGTTYRFYSGQDDQCAEMWSPDPDLLQGRLMRLVEGLRALALVEDALDRARQEATLATRARRLLGDWLAAGRPGSSRPGR